MKIVIVGAAGHVGRTVCAELYGRHELVKVGRSTGDFHADMTDVASVEAMFRRIGKVDAVVVTAGAVRFAPLTELTSSGVRTCLEDKVLGQVNVVLAGLDYVNDEGSFTLTNGLLDRKPVVNGAGAATANAALNGFVAGAAVEMPRGLRINVVSPGLLDISEERYGRFLHGHRAVPSEVVGRAYARSIESSLTGERIVGE